MSLIGKIKKFMNSDDEDNQFLEVEGLVFDNSRIFREISSDFLNDIFNDISTLSILDSVDYEGMDLSETKVQIFESKNDLFKSVEADLINEYQSNLEEGANVGWSAIYFLSTMQMYKGFICITVGLQYPKEFNQGTVYYSALICNCQGKFNYWNFD